MNPKPILVALGIINAGCFAHARRSFTDAIKTGNNKNAKSAEGLAFCNKLFEFEKQWHDVDPEERHKQRLVHSKPLLKAFLAWLKTTGELTVLKSHLVRRAASELADTMGRLTENQLLCDVWAACNTVKHWRILEISNDQGGPKILSIYCRRNIAAFCYPR